MDMVMVVRCPNCGSFAQRRLSDRLPGFQICPAQQVAQTECPICDYFMVMCWQTCRVLEAYAPGRQEPSFQKSCFAPKLHRLPLSKA